MRQLAKCLFVVMCMSSSTFAYSQANSNFASCSVSNATLPNLLSVEDNLSQYGPVLEGVQLVTLQNQRKAVIFSVRNVPVNGSFQNWNVRYKVTWQDACGRVLPDPIDSVSGFVLHPNDVRNLEVVAFHMRAVRAIFNIYIE